MSVRTPVPPHALVSARVGLRQLVRLPVSAGGWAAASTHSGLAGWAPGRVSTSMHGSTEARKHGSTEECTRVTEKSRIPRLLDFANFRDATEVGECAQGRAGVSTRSPRAADHTKASAAGVVRRQPLHIVAVELRSHCVMSIRTVGAGVLVTVIK